MEYVNNHVERTAKEITIPLAYGTIAAKEWGAPSGDPCLALHGWQDNAASFDNLIPQLSSNLHIIAIDIIGHGFSSHKPIGVPYFYLEFIYHVKCVADHLNWENFTIIGHSLGSSIALVFASLYPDMVNKVVCIDLAKPLTYPSANIAASLKTSMQTYEDAEKKTSDTQPSYLEDEMITRFIKGRFNALSEDSARILIKRGARKLEDGKYV